MVMFWTGNKNKHRSLQVMKCLVQDFNSLGPITFQFDAVKDFAHPKLVISKKEVSFLLPFETGGDCFKILGV